jgi:hypothetical protein
MLNAPTPFPHPGSAGFLTLTAEPLRILQNCADGRLLVSISDRHNPAAARTARVDPSDVFPDAEQALFPARLTARRRSVKTTNAGPAA